MPTRRLVVPVLALAVLGSALLLAAPVRGDPPEDPARAALMKAIERGKEIWNAPGGPGGKTCAECHSAGPNRMRSARLKAYPKYDKLAAKVITGQQKLNAMTEAMSKRDALALGSEDLNALEAYVSTVR